MGSVCIEAEPTDALEYVESSGFDALGKAIARFFSDLFPSTVVHVRYIRHGAAVPKDKLEDWLARTRPVACYADQLWWEDPDWWRQIAFVMGKEAIGFLKIEPTKPTWPDVFEGQLQFAPPALVNAIRFVEYAERRWAKGTSKLDPEVKEALISSLPLWVLAGIISGQLYDIVETPWDDPRFGDILETYFASTSTIVRAIQYLDHLAARRVEHEEVSHGVVITPTIQEGKALDLAPYPGAFAELTRTPLLADGVRALLIVSPHGKSIGWVTRQSVEGGASFADAYGPLGLLAAASAQFNGVGLGLRKDGSIVVFSKGRPLLLRRGGKWRGVLWDLVSQALQKDYGRVGGVVFQAALILSITGHGGVLAIVDDVPEEYLDKKDRIEVARREISQIQVHPSFPREWLFHVLLPTVDAVELGSSALAMLAAIDGATVLKRNGELLAYGAIVPVRPGKTEGARSAAAKSLSNHGLAIKVSADGPITLYKQQVPIVET